MKNITDLITEWPNLEQLEKMYISAVLEKENGSKSKAAKVLGVTVKTIYNKLEKYAAEFDNLDQSMPAGKTNVPLGGVKNTSIFG